jgi:transposase
MANNDIISLLYNLTILCEENMASIIKKEIKKKIYYYYVESKRVNGKPKLVNQKYLGTAEKLLKMAQSANGSLKNRVLYSEEIEFGAVLLIFDVAKRLGIIDIVDSVHNKRKQGASVGMYILTASINRATQPSSKSQLSDWYGRTCLPVTMGLTPKLFTAQNFWNNTCVSAEEIDRMEDMILKKVIDTYQIDTTHLIYDATNFFTYIDTMQECDIPKRGHNKEKRNDLRIVGLSLMVSPDFAIPLLHETYPGNRADATEFPIMIKKLKERYESITKKKSDITIIFDRGNNSEANIDLLESGESKLHYVGGLKKNQSIELFSIDRTEYTPFSSSALEGESACRREIEVYGRKVTALITHNPELEEGQLQGILINRQKAEIKMRELQGRLLNRVNGKITKGKKPTKESVIGCVDRILSAEYMKDICNYDVNEQNGNVCLSFDFSEEQLEQIRLEYLGKTVLFTDRCDFSNEQIVIAYRSAWHVESAFKQMKNPHHLSVRPIFHWTDEKIRIHIFTCVLAYRLCTLLIKELSDKGISISINRLVDEMSRIKKIHTFFDGNINPICVDSFTVGSEFAEQVEKLYNLKNIYG